MDQAIEHHELGQELCPGTEPGLVKNGAQGKLLPHLMAHVDRLRFPGAFHLNLVGLYRHPLFWGIEGILHM